MERLAFARGILSGVNEGSLSLLFALWVAAECGRRMGAVRGGGHHLIDALNGCTIHIVPGHHVVILELSKSIAALL